MKSNVRKILFAVIAVIAVAAGFAGVATAATLSWTLPTTRANGQALSASEIGAIKIYKAGQTAPLVTLPGAATSYTVPDCTSATYAVTASDTGGLESDPSNTGSLTPLRATCAPKAPAGLTVGP